MANNDKVDDKLSNEHNVEKDPKRTKKILIIIEAIVFLLCLSGYYIYKEIKFREPIKEDWGQKYYIYLKDKKEVIPNEAKNAMISFINTKEQKEPVMIVKYEKKKKTYANVYYIENNVVNTIIHNEPTNIELLYNIDTQIYNYYFHMENKTSDYYQTIDKQIKINKNQDNILESTPEFKFDKKESKKVTLANGEEKEVNDFNKQFIELPTSIEYVDYDDNMNDRELKVALESSIDDYRTQEEIINDVSEEMNKKIEEVKEIKELLEKLIIDDFYKKVKGYYCNKKSYLCVEFVTKDDKKYFNNFIYASEFGSEPEIIETKYKGNNIYELILADNTVEVDISDLNNKTIIVEGNELKYIAKDIDTVGRILFGY